MAAQVTIRRIGPAEARRLAGLLNRDGALRDDLGFPTDSDITPREVEKKIAEWETVHDSMCFCILEGETAVGMISLSHIDRIRGKAQTGYWIGSRYRNRGICTKAFRLLIQKAREQDIETLSSTIAVSNNASRAIWEREGAMRELKADGRLLYTLNVRELSSAQQPTNRNR